MCSKIIQNSQESSVSGLVNKSYELNVIVKYGLMHRNIYNLEGKEYSKVQSRQH